MARVSNIVITTLNILTTILALAAIATFIYLHFFINNNNHPTHCQRTVEKPILLAGLILLVISLIGLIGSSCRISVLLWIYLVFLVVLIIGWFVFAVFVFFVTNKGAGKAVSGVGFKEHRLGDYSNWLQKHVVNAKNWNQIKSCLVDTKVCTSVDLVYSKNGADFLMHNFTPIQSGCCKPPMGCGFSPKNATYWEGPGPGDTTGPATSDDPDCKTWSNEQKVLCYDCKSCKAGVLANLRKEWRSFSIFNAIILVILLIIYVIGCCAVQHKHRDQTNYKSGYP